MADLTPCPRVARAFLGGCWAILPEKFEAIAEMIELRALNGNAIEFDAAVARPPVRDSGKIAVVPVFGTITHRANLLSNASGGTSTDVLGREIDQMGANSAISTIVLDIDSPGGSAVGVYELAAKIAAVAKKKPVIAVANGTAASAAYWLASQASEIVVTPSGMVGSIGVIAMHTEKSKLADTLGIRTTIVSAGKYKAEGNPFEPLDAEALSAMQSMVDSYYADFVAAVAKGRSTTVDIVRSGFGEGRLLRAKDAIKAGMADRIASLDEVIAGLLKQSRISDRLARAEEERAAFAAMPD